MRLHFARAPRRGRLELIIDMVVAALLVSLLVAASLLIRFYGHAYADASRLRLSTQGVERSLSGAMHFMFVRGRLNVVLSRPGPISSADSAFVADRLAKARGEFEAGFSILARVDPAAAGDLQGAFADILKLKARADEQAALSLPERDPAFRARWFEGATRFIDGIGDRLSLMALGQNDLDPGFVFKRLLIMAVNYRNSFGSEASAVTSLLELGAPPTEADRRRIYRYVGLQDEAWRTLEIYSRSTANPRIAATLEEVRLLCFGEYRLKLNASRDAIFAGLPPLVSAAELTKASVAALDSLQKLLATVFAESVAYAERREREAAWGLVGGCFILLWALAAAIVAPLILRSFVFRPLEQVLSRINEACVPGGQVEGGGFGHRDEVSVLARAADRLIGATAEERALNERIQKLADTDGLTGLLNRRAFLEQSGRLISSLASLDKGYALAIADLDHFKAINDRYGHAAGDEALRRFAMAMTGSLRASDRACRFGGEEFACIFPEAGPEVALAIAERFRRAVEGLVVETGGESFGLTVSIGIAVSEPSCRLSLDRSILQADQALYCAKRQGRNRSILWSLELGPRACEEEAQ